MGDFGGNFENGVVGLQLGLIGFVFTAPAKSFIFIMLC